MQTVSSASNLIRLSDIIEDVSKHFPHKRKAKSLDFLKSYLFWCNVLINEEVKGFLDHNGEVKYMDIIKNTSYLTYLKSSNEAYVTSSMKDKVHTIIADTYENIAKNKAYIYAMKLENNFYKICEITDERDHPEIMEKMRKVAEIGEITLDTCSEEELINQCNLKCELIFTMVDDIQLAREYMDEHFSPYYINDEKIIDLNCYYIENMLADLYKYVAYKSNSSANCYFLRFMDYICPL